MSTERNDTEMYFEWWLDELKEAGLVLSYEREPKAFVLKDAIPIYFEHKYKSKESLYKNFNLFPPMIYTADYKVLFHNNLINKLFGIIKMDNVLLSSNELETGNVYENTLFYCTGNAIKFNPEGVEIYFDVKPPAKAIRYSSGLGSSREFPVKQRIIYDNEKIYINKVVPIGSDSCLFNKTFTPRRYLFNNVNGKPRKINGIPKTLNSYLQTRSILKPE